MFGQKLLIVLEYESKQQLAIWQTRLIQGDWVEPEALRVELTGLDLEGLGEHRRRGRVRGASTGPDAERTAGPPTEVTKAGKGNRPAGKAGLGREAAAAEDGIGETNKDITR